MTKYVFVTGGVVSGLGKGITAASLGRLVEAAELSDRDFFVGVQYHPEFKSRPDRPHPLFQGFIRAALHHAERKEN